MPGPRSATMMASASTTISILGVVPASSTASSALSTSSLTITSGQFRTGWPVCLISSGMEAKSARRDERYSRAQDGFHRKARHVRHLVGDDFLASIAGFRFGDRRQPSL
jgi:hypothetical protein